MNWRVDQAVQTRLRIVFPHRGEFRRRWRSGLSGIRRQPQRPAGFVFDLLYRYSRVVIA